MQVLNHKTLPDGKKRVVVLGNFDGVHKGHAKLIELARQSAEGFPVCVYTFNQNTSPFKSGSLLTTNEEKTEYIKHHGVDEIFFDDFSRVKDMTPEEFCEKVLIETLGCEIAVCGENFGFGKNRSGNAQNLSQIMTSFSKKAIVSPLYFYKEKAVSSSAIRELIISGNVSEATALLGREYAFTSEIIHGMELARKLGFPTVNQLFPEGKAKPKNGVYISLCTFDGKEYHAVSNVGTKPTVTHDGKDAPIICESHLIGFKEDIYGKPVTVKFIKKLRDETKFDSLEKLSEAVKNDVLSAKKHFTEKGL